MLGTIMNHLALAADAGEEIDLARLLTSEQGMEIEEAFRAVGWQNIVGAREKLGGRYSYELMRIYRAARLAEPSTGATPSPAAQPGMPARAVLQAPKVVPLSP